MVLKADQRSGKLTTGSISDILTKGDHPRGVKVRLIDGQVGRVQSLAASSSPSSGVGSIPTAPSMSFETSSANPGGTRPRRIGLQDDYRQDPTPLESRSLADYIRNRPPSKSRSIKQEILPEDTPQSQLEQDFPKLDSALIAAIVADHDNVEDTRTVLTSLS